MEYTVTNVQPGQITVEFADKSRAIVSVFKEHTADEIDHLVSFYDPDFMPDPETVTNTNVSCGEKRCSCKSDHKVTTMEIVVDEISDEPQKEVDPLPPNPTPLLDSAYLAFGAFYYASKGDSSVLDELVSACERFYGSIDKEDFLNGITMLEEQNAAIGLSADEVFNQAIEELENE